MPEMSIGELARHAGVNVETVRYYERRGLLSALGRTRSGYRRFDGESVRQLRFIKRAQGLGFTLKEIRELLALRDDPGTRCTDVKARAEAKIEDIDAKLRLLSAMKQALTDLAETCDGRGGRRCPILDCLDACQVPEMDKD